MSLEGRLLFGAVGGPILLILFVSLNHFGEAVAANLSLLVYFIASIVLLVRFPSSDDFGLPISWRRVLLVIMAEVAIGVSFGYTYSFLRLGALLETGIAVVLNLVSLVVTLVVVGNNPPLFSTLGLKIDG